jgi:hypothetical protein
LLPHSDAQLAWNPFTAMSLGDVKNWSKSQRLGYRSAKGHILVLDLALRATPILANATLHDPTKASLSPSRLRSNSL